MDERLAIVVGLATGLWVGVFCWRTLPTAGGGLLVVVGVITVALVAAAVWIALLASKSAVGGTATLTRLVVAAGTAAVIAAAMQPLLLTAAPGTSSAGSLLGVCFDVLATTALVVLPVANIVVDRQSRTVEQGEGKLQAK